MEKEKTEESKKMEEKKEASDRVKQDDANGNFNNLKSQKSSNLLLLDPKLDSPFIDTVVDETVTINAN